MVEGEGFDRARAVAQQAVRAPFQGMRDFWGSPEPGGVGIVARGTTLLPTVLRQVHLRLPTRPGNELLVAGGAEIFRRIQNGVGAPFDVCLRWPMTDLTGYGAMAGLAQRSGLVLVAGLATGTRGEAYGAVGPFLNGVRSIETVNSEGRWCEFSS